MGLSNGFEVCPIPNDKDEELGKMKKSVRNHQKLTACQSQRGKSNDHCMQQCCMTYVCIFIYIYSKQNINVMPLYYPYLAAMHLCPHMFLGDILVFGGPHSVCWDDVPLKFAINTHACRYECTSATCTLPSQCTPPTPFCPTTSHEARFTFHFTSIAS